MPLFPHWQVTRALDCGGASTVFCRQRTAPLVCRRWRRLAVARRLLHRVQHGSSEELKLTDLPLMQSLAAWLVRHAAGQQCKSWSCTVGSLVLIRRFEYTWLSGWN